MPFASFDPSSSDPHPVNGWWDDIGYETLPEHRVKMTAEQWAARFEGIWVVGRDGLMQQESPPPPPAPPPPVISFNALWNRFTQPEQGALAAAAMTNPALFIFLVRGAGAGQIDLLDPDTAQGMEVLVTAGVLTEARRAAILTP
jgi:hypothetical protein